MNDAIHHQPFLAAIQENPRDEANLLIYADWLEDQGDERASYLRHQVEYRSARTEETRHRLWQLYPHQHLPWVAMSEQCGAVRKNLTKYESAWWGCTLGTSRLANGRTCDRLRYEELPPLPVAMLDGTYSWLMEQPLRDSYMFCDEWKAYCTSLRQKGLFVPPKFEQFYSSQSLTSRMRFYPAGGFPIAHNPRKWYTARELELPDGLLVSIFSLHRIHMVWAILLPREPGRYAPIIGGPSKAVFPRIWECAHDDDDSPKRTDSRTQVPSQQANAETYTDGEIYDETTPDFVASNFEVFISRYWLENEIRFAMENSNTQRPLTTVEQTYLDHYQQQSGHP